jgi:DNA-damage-inducible protein J
MKTIKTAVVHASIEMQTKTEAEAVLRQLGLTPTDAIRIFYAQILLRGGLPFAVEIPNGLTKETLDKSQRGEDIEVFNSLDDMFASWKT